jgi:hypothetical protein
MPLDLYTQSELQTFCDCRVKHKLSYDDLLKPKSANTAFYLGSLVHKWLEYYYLGKPQALDLVVKEVSKDYTDKMKDDQIRESNEAIAALKSIVEVYPKFDPVIKYKLQVRAVEHQFYNPDPQVPSRKGSGKIDIAAIAKDGKIWIMDHKTVSRFEDKYVNSFRLNRQMQTYLMAVRCDPVLKNLGRTIGGIIPNIIRKPSLRKKETEGDDVFLKRVKDDILSRPEEYFYSDMIVYEDDVNKRFESAEWPIVREMRNPNRLIYPNFSQCYNFGRCPFYAICTNEPGHQSLYMKKTTRHEELTKEAIKATVAKNAVLEEVAPKSSSSESKKPVKKLDDLLTNLRRKNK